MTKPIKITERFLNLIEPLEDLEISSLANKFKINQEILDFLCYFCLNCN